MSGAQKIMSLIGIAKKAGKVISGTDMAVESVRSGRKNSVKLLVVACDASRNTLKRIDNTSAYYQIPVIKLDSDKAELARITGHSSTLSVIGITDTGFAKAMQEAAIKEANEAN
ncbi:MAG: ribosomal L7Ae/L30e/S12e/Gadd45 family protein [Clostridia bacterium]|nr:ribosomal L7Ae/L30e/S12e/Gadd45 family protein [Clostridia bacterium]